MWKANSILSYHFQGRKHTQQFVIRALTQAECAIKVQAEIEEIRRHQLGETILPTIITTYEHDKLTITDQIVKGRLFVGIIRDPKQPMIYVSSYSPPEGQTYDNSLTFDIPPGEDARAYRDAARDILEMGGATVVLED